MNVQYINDTKWKLSFVGMFYVTVGEGCEYHFTVYYEEQKKLVYKRVCRFIRLVEMGYAPARANLLANDFETGYSRGSFEYWFVPELHTEFPVPFIPEGFTAAEDVMFTGELTIEERAKLYKMWLEEGDEIFCFESEWFDDINIPALLSDFRALAQGQDDISGDWTHTHHSDVIQY